VINNYQLTQDSAQLLANLNNGFIILSVNKDLILYSKNKPYCKCTLRPIATNNKYCRKGIVLRKANTNQFLSTNTIIKLSLIKLVFIISNTIKLFIILIITW